MKERQRGEELLAQKAVSISTATDVAITARVRASGAPKVTLTADDVASDTFVAQCTCAGFQKGQACRHVWAVVLKLQADGADFMAHKIDMELASPVEDAAKALAKERQRARARERRGSAPTRPRASIYPAEVDEALAFFAANGFDLRDDLDQDKVEAAKRALARVFHPDRGGSHDEALALNHHVEILKSYLAL